MMLNSSIIESIRFNPDSKWVEFWVEDNGIIKNISCKEYMLWEAVKKAVLYNDIMKHGFIGIAIDINPDQVTVDRAKYR